MVVLAKQKSLSDFVRQNDEVAPTMPNLTVLQHRLIQRLNFVGLEDLAERARAAWSANDPSLCTFTPAERATMEGAKLCEEFKLANRQAKAAEADKKEQQPRGDTQKTPDSTR